MTHIVRRLLTAAGNAFDFRGRQRRKQQARIEKLERALRALQVRSDAEHSALKRSSAARHRRVLSPDVLRDILPLRARTIPARAVHAGADQYDLRLQEVSPAYRDALASAAEPHAELVSTDVQGLRWWVPVPSLGREAVERVIAKQRFPYRNITQTRELTPGPVMLDIGANVGRMSIPRVILGDCQQAYCAEPDPLNFAALVRNIAGNGLRGLVLPDCAAIGSASGTARLTRAKYSGGHRLAAPDRPEAAMLDVPCWTLDDWCGRLSIDPDLVAYVKVDTQGHEVHVLRGATELLRRAHIAWQLEVSPSMLAVAGNSAAELYALCAERFTHFIDLAKGAEGPRARPTRELAPALEYLLRDAAQTDILLFNAASRSTAANHL